MSGASVLGRAGDGDMSMSQTNPRTDVRRRPGGGCHHAEWEEEGRDNAHVNVAHVLDYPLRMAETGLTGPFICDTGRGWVSISVCWYACQAWEGRRARSPQRCMPQASACSNRGKFRPTHRMCLRSSTGHHRAVYRRANSQGNTRHKRG